MINRKTNKSILAGILATFALISFCPVQAGAWEKLVRSRTLVHGLECIGGTSLMAAGVYMYNTATERLIIVKRYYSSTHSEQEVLNVMKTKIFYKTGKIMGPVIGFIGLVFTIHGLYKLLRNKKNNGNRDNNADDSSDNNKADNGNND